MKTNADILYESLANFTDEEGAIECGAKMRDFARELERERDDLVKAGNALRDALAFEGVKIGDLPREIKEWDALVSALPNAQAEPDAQHPRQ